MSCDQCDKLRKAGEKIVEGFGVGIFMRNVAADADPKWAMNLFPYIQALAVFSKPEECVHVEAAEPPRCPVCGYSQEDADALMDHNLCKGNIPGVDPADADALDKAAGISVDVVVDTHEPSEGEALAQEQIAAEERAASFRRAATARLLFADQMDADMEAADGCDIHEDDA